MKKIFKKRTNDRKRADAMGVKKKIVIYAFFIAAILFTIHTVLAQNEEGPVITDEDAPIESIETETLETVEADETAEADMETTDEFTLLKMFELGGIFMWPLLAFSIATISIGLERLIYFLYHSLKMNDITLKSMGFISNKDYKGAIEYLEPLTKKQMGARVLLAIFKRSSPFSEHHVEKAAETEAMICINSLEKGFSFLVALGSLSPLTGFLGTVSGMIGAFRSIAEATEVNAQIVANGIYEALITTVFGLVIAIFAMVFHSIFTNISDRFIADVEKNCSNVIAEISEQKLKLNMTGDNEA